MKALHNRHSHVRHSTLIHRLTQIRYVGLNSLKRRLFMYLNGNFNMVHENFNISTGPKIIFISKVLNLDCSEKHLFYVN